MYTGVRFLVQDYQSIPSFSIELCPAGSDVKLEFSMDKWRPLLVEVGALGCVTGISKIAASVIGPLADRNVSVFCLSTNMDDYVMVGVCVLSLVTACEDLLSLGEGM